MRFLAPLLLISFLPGLAAAQQAPSPAPGDRIRVSAPQVFARPLTGIYLGSGSGRVVVQEDVQRQDTVEIPLELVRRVEISRGYPSSTMERVRRGALQGLGGGLLVGGSIGLIRGYGAQYRNPDAGVNVPAVTARTAARLGVVGTVLGSAFGLRARERWERLPISRLAVAPDEAGGVSLHGSARF
jgi:hypothetical protein